MRGLLLIFNWVEERIRRIYHWEDWFGWDEVLERINRGDANVEEHGWEDYPFYDDEDELDMPVYGYWDELEAEGEV